MICLIEEDASSWESISAKSLIADFDYTITFWHVPLKMCAEEYLEKHVQILLDSDGEVSGNGLSGNVTLTFCF